DLMRDNLSNVLTATLDLGKPVDELFADGDPAAAKHRLDAASKAFDVAISVDHYDEDTTPVLTAGSAMNPGGHGGLAMWFPKINAKFQANEAEIRFLKKKQVAESEAAIASFAASEVFAARVHSSK